MMVSDHSRIDSFLQAANSMHSLGLGHILLLGLTRTDCEAVNQVVPDIGCAWTSFILPHDFDKIPALWSLRYRTLARL